MMPSEGEIKFVFIIPFPIKRTKSFSRPGQKKGTPLWRAFFYERIGATSWVLQPALGRARVPVSAQALLSSLPFQPWAQQP